jgi:hypothetical protein
LQKLLGMNRFSSLWHRPSLVLFAILTSLAACSSSNGATVDTKAPVHAGDDAGDARKAPVHTGDDAGDAAMGTVNSGGNTDGSNGCVDIELSAADLACSVDSDCSSVVTGTVCPGWVPNGPGAKLGTLCYDSAANSTGAAKVTAELASIPHGEDAGHDFCDQGFSPGEWALRCIASQCVQCAFSDSPLCKDGGAAVNDGSVTKDAAND